MSCRKILCHECTTQWEGINYCRKCVGALATAPVVRATPIRLILMVVISAALAFLLVRVAVGLGVYIAGMF